MADEITLVDREVDEIKEDVEYQSFETDEPVEIGLGDTAGHPVTTEAKHFVAARVEHVEATDEMQQAMGAPPLMETLEASIFISNEDGEIGAGLEDVRLEGEVDVDVEGIEEEGGDVDYEIVEDVSIEDAIEAFMEEYL